jgi:beta-glucanase (GH16 family)
MESRGNRDLTAWTKKIGVQEVGATVHCGVNHGRVSSTSHTKNNPAGYDKAFHVYKLLWTPNKMSFYIDNALIGTISAGEGFWARGNFGNSGEQNPWAGNKMAPFDKEFFVIMNLAVGGTTGYFPDNCINRPNPKPW